MGSEFRGRLIYFTAIFLSLALTPLIFRLVIGLLVDIEYDLTRVKYLALGFLASILFLPFSKTMKWLYIFFHELSHAIAVVLFSGKIFSFNVGVESGHIQSDKDNLVIRLAPYLFPLLPILILLGHFVMLIFNRYESGVVEDIYFTYFLISFLYGFVTFYNFKLIIRETSDIEMDRLALSFSLIINSYLLTSAGTFYFLFKGVDIIDKYYLIS